MVGEWVEERPDASVRLSCRWAEGGNFLLREVTVKREGKPVMSISQRIGWDPLARQIRSWEFDSAGGFGEGRWSRDGDRWTIKHTGVQAEGTVSSATNIMTNERPDVVRWVSTDRVVGDDDPPRHRGRRAGARPAPASDRSRRPRRPPPRPPTPRGARDESQAAGRRARRGRDGHPLGRDDVRPRLRRRGGFRGGGGGGFRGGGGSAGVDSGGGAAATAGAVGSGADTAASAAATAEVASAAPAQVSSAAGADTAACPTCRRSTRPDRRASAPRAAMAVSAGGIPTPRAGAVASSGPDRVRARTRPSGGGPSITAPRASAAGVKEVARPGAASMGSRARRRAAGTMRARVESAGPSGRAGMPSAADRASAPSRALAGPPWAARVASGPSGRRGPCGPASAVASPPVPEAWSREGRGGAAAGPGGAIAGGSRGGVAVGPGGAVAGRGYGVAGYRPYGDNVFGAYHHGWVHGGWNGHGSPAWGMGSRGLGRRRRPGLGPGVVGLRLVALRDGLHAVYQPVLRRADARGRRVRLFAADRHHGRPARGRGRRARGVVVRRRARLVQAGGLRPGLRAGRRGPGEDAQRLGPPRVPRPLPLRPGALRRLRRGPLRRAVGRARLGLDDAHRALPRRRDLHRAAPQTRRLLRRQHRLGLGPLRARLPLPDPGPHRSGGRRTSSRWSR